MTSPWTLISSCVISDRILQSHREEGSDILILARTDARQAVSLEEALWRVAAFADAGADILFIVRLHSVCHAICSASQPTLHPTTKSNTAQLLQSATC